MLERDVEKQFKALEKYGFKVLKLRTPGYNGTMDRMILWPKYAPKPPVFVEVKRPGEQPRRLQVEVAIDWRKRGCDVRDYCDTPDKVGALCLTLLEEARQCLTTSG